MCFDVVFNKEYPNEKRKVLKITQKLNAKTLFKDNLKIHVSMLTGMHHYQVK